MLNSMPKSLRLISAVAEKPARTSPKGDACWKPLTSSCERDRAGHAVERELAVDDEVVTVARGWPVER